VAGVSGGVTGTLEDTFFAQPDMMEMIRIADTGKVLEIGLRHSMISENNKYRKDVRL
jgi:hypothetical protein